MDTSADTSAPGDDGGGETGAVDSGPEDSDPGDTSVTDTSVTDTSVTDTSVTDTAVTDTAVTDTSVTDTSVTDTAVTDTAVTDTGDTGTSTLTPCSLTLPADTEVFTSSGSSTTAGATLLVCPRATVSYTGDGGTMVILGRGQGIVSGTGDRILADDRSDLLILAGSHSLEVTASATVDDRTGTSTTTVCSSLTIDTSLLPSGC